MSRCLSMLLALCFVPLIGCPSGDDDDVANDDDAVNDDDVANDDDAADDDDAANDDDAADDDDATSNEVSQLIEAAVGGSISLGEVTLIVPAGALAEYRHAIRGRPHQQWALLLTRAAGLDWRAHAADRTTWAASAARLHL